MQDKKDVQQNIERFRSKSALTGLVHGAFFGALALVAISEIWLNPNLLRFNLDTAIELIIGGFVGGLLGFFIGLSRSVYLSESWKIRGSRK